MFLRRAWYTTFMFDFSSISLTNSARYYLVITFVICCQIKPGGVGRLGSGI